MKILSHVKKRPMEAWLGSITAGLGLWTLLPSTSMGSSGYTKLLSMTNEPTWGILFFLVGLASWLSVVLNGLRWWTPFTRATMNAATAILYAAWTGGFWGVNPASTAVYVYLCLTIVSVRCFYLAALDVIARVGELRARTNTRAI